MILNSLTNLLELFYIGLYSYFLGCLSRHLSLSAFFVDILAGLPGFRKDQGVS